MKIVSFNNTEIFTESFGDFENPAILLIMGASSSMIWWESEFCEKLANNGFFVIRFDNRDTGKSTHYPIGKPDYSFDDMAEDAVRVLDAYGIKKAVIMGMSMGGMLAQIIAVRHPERISGLVLLCSVFITKADGGLPQSSDEVNVFFEAIAKTIPAESSGDIVNAALAQWQSTNQSSRPHDLEYIRKMISYDAERALCYESRTNHFAVRMNDGELGRISQIAAPVLVIQGTEDVVIPYQHGVLLSKTLPSATLLTLNGAGHELHRNDYDLVVKNIHELFA